MPSREAPRVTRLEVALQRVAEDLRASGQRFALVGGVAMSVRAAARFTRDVDWVVAVADDAKAETVVREFFARGYRLLAQVEQEEADRLLTVRFLAPSQDGAAVVVDFLFAACGIEDEVVRDAEAIEVQPGVVVPVARREPLIAMKLLARDDVRRPQDHGDLIALLARADPAEIGRAEAAVRLIEARGFAQGKDLVGALRALVAAHRPAR